MKASDLHETNGVVFNSDRNSFLASFVVLTIEGGEQLWIRISLYFFCSMKNLVTQNNHRTGSSSQTIAFRFSFVE